MARRFEPMRTLYAVQRDGVTVKLFYKPEWAQACADREGGQVVAVKREIFD